MSSDLGKILRMYCWYLDLLSLGKNILGELQITELTPLSRILYLNTYEIRSREQKPTWRKETISRHNKKSSLLIIRIQLEKRIFLIKRSWRAMIHLSGEIGILEKKKKKTLEKEKTEHYRFFLPIPWKFFIFFFWNCLGLLKISCVGTWTILLLLFRTLHFDSHCELLISATNISTILKVYFSRWWGMEREEIN